MSILARNLYKSPATPKRVVFFGKNGSIAKYLRNNLKKNYINHKFIGSKEINLLNSKSSKKISNVIKKDDVLVFISAKAPAKNFDDYIKNIKMMINFCKYCDYNKISQLIYISSDAVYSDSTKPLTEKSKTNPQNIHGLMHIARENLLNIKFSKKLLIIRPTLIYGSTDTHDGYGPNLFIRSIKKNKSINIFGKGEELRDHLYIGDLFEILIYSIKFKTLGIFNISSGKLISFKKILDNVQKLNKKYNKPINYIKRNSPMPHNGYRPISNKLVKKLFGFKFNSFNDVYRKIYRTY
tara:strand:- start:49 stop:933 length:885 start_codon:yes stop_codon:yes gene_type:complete